MSPDPSPDSQRHYRICPLCEACCGLEVRSRDQQVISVRGWAGDVLSDGYLCPKGVALKDLHEDPDRLRQPLIRRGGRNSPLQPASWDEAYALIAARLPPLLAEHGRDSLALVAGNPSAHKMGLLLYFARLARAVGSKNVYSASTLDQMPRQLASGLLYGHWLSVPLPDLPRTDFMLILGANPVASNGSMWTVPDFRGKARALRERGGRLVVIDPRRTETADLADQHLAIRPGADALLLAAMIHTLFAEERVTLGRAAAWIAEADVQALREALAPFTPEAVAGRCGISAEQITTLARDFAAAPRACAYGRIGTCTQSLGTLATWLIDLLNILTGRLDVEGGLMFAQAAAFAANTQGTPGRGRGVATGRHRSRVSGAPEVFGELPIVKLAEEIETPGPGQVRAAIVMSANPVLSAPGGERLAQALQGLDFMVSLDIYCNETSRLADVILPGLSPLEEGHYDVPFPQLSWRNQARYSRPVFEPAAGQPAEWQSLLQLIAIVQGRGALAGQDLQALDDELLSDDLRRQGLADAAPVLAALKPWTGPERLVDLALRSGPYGEGWGDGFGKQPGGLNLARVADAQGGIDLGALSPRLPGMLRTPTGRVDIAHPMLLADLPRALAELQAPAPAAGQLSLIGRRDSRSNNSWMHNLPTLAKGPERCTLQLHPDDAQRLGLVEGASAQLSGRQGRISAPVEITERVRPGVACLPHGWGHDLPGSRLSLAAQRPGANLNAVLDDGLIDPLSGNAVLSGVAVSVSPA